MGLQEIDAYLGQSQPSATPPRPKQAGGGIAAIDAYLGGQGLGTGESFARGFMGSIPAQIALALAKRGIVAQAGEIPPTEELPPPGEIAAAARRMEESLVPQGEPTVSESVSRGLGTVIADLPFYVAGGYGAANLAKPLLSKIPPLLAKAAPRVAGGIGAFEAPAVLREAAIQAGEGEFEPGRFAKEMGIAGGTGTAVGVASLIPNPLLRVPAEVVAMVGAESLLREGRLPTFKELLEGGVTIAALQAAFRLAGLAFPGGERAGGPVRGTESPDFKAAMETARPVVRPIPGLVREAMGGKPPAEPLGAPTIPPEPPAARPVAVQPAEARAAPVAPRVEPRPTVVQYPSLVDTAAFKEGTPVDFGPDAIGQVSRILSSDSLVVRRADGSEVVVTASRKIPLVTVPTPSPVGVGDPIEYRPKLSDRPITGAVIHVNTDGTVNIRARAGGVIRKVPAEKVTLLLTPDEVGLDSQRIGNRVALGPDDKAILGEMRETLRDVGGEVGQKIFLEGGEVGRGGDVTVKGFKTGKPSWMEIPDSPGDYYKYPEVIKVLETLRQRKWPKTAKQARIAEQLLQEARFDAENEKARLAGWEQQALESETAPVQQPSRDQAIRDSFFAEVERLAAEEAGAAQPPSAPAVTPPQPTPVTEAPRGTAQGPGVSPAVSPGPVAPALTEGQRVAYTPPGEQTAFPATIATGGVHADRTYTVKLGDAVGGELVPYVSPESVRPLVTRTGTAGAPGGVERRAEITPPAEVPPPVAPAAKAKEAPGTTLGSLGGAFQEAAGYLPESVRNLPAAYRAQVQKGIDYITAKMPKILKEARGLGQEYVDIVHDRGAALANYIERAVELSGKLQEGLTPSEKARVDQVLRGGITTNPAIERLVNPVRALIDELQAKLVKYGYLTPEDVQMFQERFRSHPEYLRRLYETKLVPPDQPLLAGEMTGPVGRGVKSEALMMRGDIQRVKLPLMGGEPLVGAQRAEFLAPWLKKGYRLLSTEGDTATLFRDIPETIRKAMGEIRTQPGFVAAKTAAEQARIVANHEFLAKISEHPGWAKPGLTEAELTSGEWTRLTGDKKKWGPLADMFVKKEVALEVQSSLRLRQDWEKVIGRLVGMWKFGKVIVNPAAMGRNIISSGILADFGGLHPWMVDEWAKGAAGFAKQGGLWGEAKKMGLFRSTYTANEIMGLADGLARSNNPNAILRVLDGIHEIAEATGKKTGIRPAVLYGTIENFYRYNLYRYGREGLGLTPIEARRYALKYAIDYEVVSPTVAALRGTGGGWAAPLFALGGSPFITFSAKAIPLTLETAALHPLRVGKYLALIYGVSRLAGSQIGQREEETTAQRQLGQLNPLRYALLPWRDKDGRAQYYDLGYTLPFGDLIEMLDVTVGGQGRRANVAFLPVVGHPTFAVAEAILNKSGFTGKELSAPSDTALQSVQKRVGHIYQSWMPSLAPPAPGLEKGGFGYEDLRRAFATPPETDFLGRTRSPVAALLANVAGLRARGVTTAELANFKARQYDEMFKALDKELITVATRFQQNPEERDRRIAEVQQRYIEIAKEARALFGLIPPDYSRPGPPPPATRSSIPEPIQRAMEGRRPTTGATP